MSDHAFVVRHDTGGPIQADVDAQQAAHDIPSAGESFEDALPVHVGPSSISMRVQSAINSGSRRAVE